MRGVKPGGRIWEGSFKNGKKHGLLRTVDKRSVSIELWKSGVLVSRFQFDEHFQETERDDIDNLLSDLTPDQFEL